MINLGVSSECQRGSYFLARRLAKLNGKRDFMMLRSNDDNYHWIDLRGGQIIPYQWDRRAHERKTRMMEAVNCRENAKLLHVVLRPAASRIPLIETKGFIASFRKALSDFSRVDGSPKILLAKFEVNLHLYGAEEAYLHCHALVDADNARAFRQAWAEFATKKQLPRVLDRSEVIAAKSIEYMVSYLAKHPAQIDVNGTKYPFYHPRGIREVTDSVLLDLQETFHRTQFIWLPRSRSKKVEQPTLNIRPSFTAEFVNWLTRWMNDYRQLQRLRGYSKMPQSQMEAQISRAHRQSGLGFKKWYPIHYMAEIGLSVVNWPKNQAELTSIKNVVRIDPMKTMTKNGVILKLDSRNRVTLKNPISRFYATYVNPEGEIILKPCSIGEPSSGCEQPLVTETRAQGHSILGVGNLN